MVLADKLGLERVVNKSIQQLELLGQWDIIRVCGTDGVEGTMKRHRSFLILVELMLVAAASLPVAGVANAQAGPVQANQIVIQGQETNNTNQIVVDSVTAAQDGWLIIYTNPCGQRCAMIGYGYVHHGQNTHFTVNIDSDAAEPFPALWAILHVDKGVLGLLEWPGPDEPVLQNGQPVMVAFATQATPQPGPAPAATAIARTSKGYPKLQADYRIYNWRKPVDTPGELVGAIEVRASGGDGHYTYQFIGTATHSTNTFDFHWRACSALVESLHVWSGDGQKIDVPVWRSDVPCPQHWPTEEPTCDCNCGCNCTCTCDCDSDCP
jgi:hypothetical protein